MSIDDREGQHISNTQWTIENYPASGDWDAFYRFVEETTPTERAAPHAAYMRSQGLVQWREMWVTPEKAQELEERYRENRKKEREALRAVAEMKRYARHWPWG